MKKQLTKITAFLITLALAFTILPVDAQAATKMKLNKSQLTLYTSGTFTLKASGASRKVSFSSSNKSVATVNGKGKITAKKAGKATITVKAGSEKKTCKVTVKKEKLKLNKSEITLYKGKTYTLKVSGTSRKVSFLSSNKSVATVSSSGKVTAKKAGKATITAKVGKSTIKCKVTVKEKSQSKEVSIYWNGEKAVTVAKATGLVDWESSNKTLVTVKSSGTNKAILTGKKVGKAVITAKVGGKVVEKYTVIVKMKTTPLTEKEKALAFYAQSKYDCPDTLLGDSEMIELGLKREDENQNLWNTHKKALEMTKKLLPGRDVYICDVNTREDAGRKWKELDNKGVKYASDSCISHDHGKTEKWSVMWIK